MGSIIIGSGMDVPDTIVTNDNLARVMDTTDEWIRRRTGVVERRFAAAGEGASDLGARAGLAAIADAAIHPEEVDVVITATMTPDFLAPGIASLVQHKLGLSTVAAYDIRQQCSGFLYGLEMADALLAAGKAETALVIGTEVHGGFLPFGETWANLFDESPHPPTEAEYERNTRFRSWSVLFGDGAGAVVVRRGTDEDTGILGVRLRSDGALFDLIHVPGVGFSRRPYVDASQLDAELHLPSMRGRELFRNAVELMPDAIRGVAEDTKVELEDIDVVVAHQANARIVEGVRRALGMDEDTVPINIDRYGNTTAATVPILFHELRMDGRIPSGALVCFAAFGAGAHWGAALYREP